VSDGERSEAVRRVRALIEGARRIADASNELGRRARAELGVATGLSPEGVELALVECLETNVTDAELAGFCAGVEPARRAHVLLSANVFVAAHRAVALGLAGSASVQVRPSRREPVFARLLAEAAPRLFDVVTELAPEPGDAVFAYGADETLETVRTTLPPGISFHAHGSGFGVAVVDASHATRETARALALDVAPFDQRGCLSPRMLIFVGSDAEACVFAELVAAELATLAERVPLGTLDPDEAADVARFRDAVTYAGRALSAGPGWVAVVAPEALVAAPVGRNLALVPSNAPERLLAPHASSIAALGYATSALLVERVSEALPFARSSALGRMQRPPFDGPVDRRTTTHPRK
jgi:hypothetical protein